MSVARCSRPEALAVSGSRSSLKIAQARRDARGGAGTGSTQLDALENGSAFAELPGWRVIAVRGDDAAAWLHDLITADVEGLSSGQSRRSLLLTPTGRIRADLHVARLDGSFLLLQEERQPEPVDAALTAYVLSSDVELEDRTERSVVVAVLGGDDAEVGDDTIVLAPSVLGRGHDVIVPPGAPVDRLRERLRERGLAEVTTEDLETWRIRRGVVRMGSDFGPEALPAEAGLDDAIDFTKGCFLGQESVAKVRNLGHPPWVLRLVRSKGPIARGATVWVDGATVGAVTSSAAGEGGTDAIIRVRWDAASGPLSTETGPLSLRQG
jgi:tRNA-modifying protein YgfZ